MEIVKEINEIDWQSYDGFEIITTQQTIRLLISNGQLCCENWGCFLTNDDIEDFIGAELISISATDSALNTKKLDETLPYGLDSGGIIFINLETSKGVLQFTAYNNHNGYYGHTVKIESEQLNMKDIV